MKICSIVFPLFCLVRSAVAAYDLPHIIPNGIVEDFIDPNKLSEQEFPDASVAEAVPEVMQKPEELAGELESQHLPQVIPGGVVEQLIDPYHLEKSGLADEAIAEAAPESVQETLSQVEETPAIVQEEAKPAEPAVVPEVAAQEEAKPAEAALVPVVAAQEEAKPAEAEVVAEVAVQEEAKPANAEVVSEVVVEEVLHPVMPDEVQATPTLSGGIVEQFADPYKGEQPEASDRSIAASASNEEEIDSKDLGFDSAPCCDPEKKWYFEFKPGYFLFTDKDMQKFYDNGGFTFRFEGGCKVWGPMIVWFDAGYFQKSGKAIGGDHDLDIKLATITLGLKGIYYFNSYAAFYAGAGPRLFMMMMKNDSPYVRGEDNEIGIGGGFDAGFWFFPIPQWKNFFLDLFADYSWKKLKVEADEISSYDFDVDVSGLSVGLGLGIKF